MRLISEAFNELKEKDKNSALTLYGLTTLVKSGSVGGVVKIGRKTLVNMEVLEQYLQGEIPAQQPQIISYNGIRRISGV